MLKCYLGAYRYSLTIEELRTQSLIMFSYAPKTAYRYLNIYWKIFYQSLYLPEKIKIKIGPKCPPCDEMIVNSRSPQVRGQNLAFVKIPNCCLSCWPKKTSRESGNCVCRPKKIRLKCQGVRLVSSLAIFAVCAKCLSKLSFLWQLPVVCFTWFLSIT